jgi:hypothetical protein
VTTAPRGDRARAANAEEGTHRTRHGEDVAGDDDQAHLHAEGQQFPEAAAPGTQQIEGTRVGEREPECEGQHGEENCDDPGVGTQRVLHAVKARATRCNMRAG